MVDINDTRIIFRPTDEQKIRMDRQVARGRFYTRSEFLRWCVELGLKQLEGEKTQDER